MQLQYWNFIRTLFVFYTFVQVSLFCNLLVKGSCYYVFRDRTWQPWRKANLLALAWFMWKFRMKTYTILLNSNLIRGTCFPSPFVDFTLKEFLQNSRLKKPFYFGKRLYLGAVFWRGTWLACCSRWFWIVS